MSTTTFSSGIDTDVVAAAGAPGQGYLAQAQIIAEAGVDLIILEMMRDVEQTRLCLEAALSTGLPVWLGLSAERADDGTLVLFGSTVPFASGVEQILAKDTDGLQVVGVMHSQLELTSEALHEVQALWSGPRFAYPHHGVFELPHWRFDNTLTPEEFADAALAWAREGATAVGGCCGIRPARIAAVRRRLQRRTTQTPKRRARR
jgi:homocysteine S-methyltransferase